MMQKSSFKIKHFHAITITSHLECQTQPPSLSAPSTRPAAFSPRGSSSLWASLQRACLDTTAVSTTASPFWAYQGRQGWDPACWAKGTWPQPSWTPISESGPSLLTPNLLTSGVRVGRRLQSREQNTHTHTHTHTAQQERHHGGEPCGIWAI